MGQPNSGNGGGNPYYGNWNWETALNNILGLSLPARSDITRMQWLNIQTDDDNSGNRLIFWANSEKIRVYFNSTAIEAYNSPWWSWTAWLNEKLLPAIQKFNYGEMAVNPRYGYDAALAFSRTQYFSLLQGLIFASMARAMGNESAGWKGNAAGAFRTLTRNIANAFGDLYFHLENTRGLSYAATMEEVSMALHLFVCALPRIRSGWAENEAYHPQGAIRQVMREHLTTRENGYVENWRSSYFGDLAKGESWKRIENEAKERWIGHIQNTLDTGIKAAVQELAYRYQTAYIRLRPYTPDPLPPVVHPDDIQESTGGNNRDINDILNQIGDGFTQLSDGLNNIGDGFSDLGNNIGDSFTKLGDSIGDGFSDLGNNIGDGFSDLGNNIGNGFSDFGNNLGNRLGDGFSNLSDGFSNLGNRLGDGFSNLGNGFDNLGNVSGPLGPGGPYESMLPEEVTIPGVDGTFPVDSDGNVTLPPDVADSLDINPDMPGIQSPTDVNPLLPGVQVPIGSLPPGSTGIGTQRPSGGGQIRDNDPDTPDIQLPGDGTIVDTDPDTPGIQLPGDGTIPGGQTPGIQVPGGQTPDGRVTIPSPPGSPGDVADGVVVPDAPGGGGLPGAGGGGFDVSSPVEDLVGNGPALEAPFFPPLEGVDGRHHRPLPDGVSAPSSGRFVPPGQADGSSSAAGSRAMGPSGIPFFPPMAGMGGMGMGGHPQERERTTWLAEDEKVWGTNPDVGPAVIGRGDIDIETDFDEEIRPTSEPQRQTRTKGRSWS